MNPDGEEELDAVVMDGTATGILDNLPKIERWTKLVPGIISRSATRQYIMPTPKNRAFIECVLVSALRNIESEKFNASLVKKLRTTASKYVSLFFPVETSNGDSNSQDIYIREVSMFFQSCYSEHESRADTELENSSSLSDDESSSLNLRLEHRITEYDLRYRAIDFGRCFISGSIAGFSLRHPLAVVEAEKVS